jgi:tetratricopeptide (TPR) repeat protein
VSADDPKNAFTEGLGDLDWDSALDDWEKNAFTPSIAPAVESAAAVQPEKPEKPASDDKPDLGVPLVVKAEEPPELPTQTQETLAVGAAPQAPASGFGPEPSTKPGEALSEAPVTPPITVPPPTPTPPGPATAPPPPAPASSRGGGLGQLFSRASSPSFDIPPAVETDPGPFSDNEPPPEDDATLIRASKPPPAPPPPPPSPPPPPPPPPEPIRQRIDTPIPVIKLHDDDDDVEADPLETTASLDDMPDEETRELPAMRALPRAPVEPPKTLLARLPDIQDEPGDDDATLMRPSKPPPAPVTAFTAAPTREAPKVAEFVDAVKAEKFLARITWLEEEARSLEDHTARGRALLACSELAAIAGDRDRALAFANEAREVAPTLPLAGRQARQLLPRDADVLAEALDAEASDSPTPASRVHAVLLAADVLRASGNGDAAMERWDSACKLEPSDPRAPAARAAIALAQESYGSGALRLSDNSELVVLDKAVATALRLRGIERPGDVEDLAINDGLRHARTALTDGDVVSAAQSVGEIAAVPEVAHGALWLSAVLGAVHIASRRGAGRSLKTLATDEKAGKEAQRQLAARGIELGDAELVTTALASESAFTPAERAVVTLLSAKTDVAIDDATVARLANDVDLLPLADAVSALSPVIAEDGGREAIIRSRRVAGKQANRALTGLGRLLAAKEPDIGIEESLEGLASPSSATAAGIELESAVRGKRWAEVSEAISKLSSEPEANVAAAIIAERAGDKARAKEAWQSAAKRGGGEGILRIAAEVDPDVDLGAGLLKLADDQADGLGPAILRLEAIARKGAGSLEAEGALLERIHRAAPGLGIGAFLAERVARRRGDVDEVLKWITERRAIATDPFENVLDAVREALLVADRDPELAARRLEEAHNARPDDVALRELYERLAVEPPDDRGAWREKRAAKAAGQKAALAWVEAAREYDRANKPAEMLKAARAAIEAGDKGLALPLRERAEEATGETERQTEVLLEVTKAESSKEDERREALERLADLDAFSKKDTATAMLWHRTILEEWPRHLASLRWVEHGLITEGREEELGPIFEAIAIALDGTAGGEVTGHAQHAARLRVREGAGQPVVYGEQTPFEKTHDMARLAATQPEASLWSLRQLNAHARLRQDDAALYKTTLALLERTQRPFERGTLLLRASEAAARLGQTDEARKLLEQAAAEDPGDVVTWGFLAEVRERAGEPKAAAEACESLARTSVVREHQLLAWHDAAKIWGDEVKDAERSMAALEAASEIDPTYADVFPRLTALYAERRLDHELAHLLQRRLDGAHDDEEKVALQVELARAFAEMGELPKAKTTLASALEKRPDHTTALAAMADIASREGDWNAAESAYVRLARLLPDPVEQRQIYEQLGEIYAVHAPNLSRAEVAYKEVLKRSIDDHNVLVKLVDVYKRMGDVAQAATTQQEIIAGANDPEARLSGLVELARIYETVGRDPRKSEQVLDSARKEFPTSVIALRAMAEFYSRQRQMPAMQILLDRAAGDARRAFAQGRFVPSLFEVLHAAFELRGKRDAARVTAATLAAVQGRPSELLGAEAGAVDPRLDDLLAPDLMSAALRTLFIRAGSALDAVSAVDLRALKATPLQPGTPIGATVGSVATVVGLGALQILVSPNLGRIALPLATNPPTLLVGEPLARSKNEGARMFIVVRALKMILSHASVMIRASEADVPVLIAALFTAFNPTFAPANLDKKRHQELARRLGAALPRNIDPTVGVIALEAAGFVASSWGQLAFAGASWANRAALLAVGDPNAALDALAWTMNEDAAPTKPEERAAWIARHIEARDLMTFSVTDAYAEARMRLGLEK